MQDISGGSSRPRGESISAPDLSAERLKLALWLRWSVRIRPGREAKILADPAWDIILELYILHCEGRSSDLDDLSLRTRLPQSVCARWINVLIKYNYIHVGCDNIKFFIITDFAFEEMDVYLSKLLASVERCG